MNFSSLFKGQSIKIISCVQEILPMFFLVRRKVYLLFSCVSGDCLFFSVL